MEQKLWLNRNLEALQACEIGISDIIHPSKPSYTAWMSRLSRKHAQSIACSVVIDRSHGSSTSTAGGRSLSRQSDDRSDDSPRGCRYDRRATRRAPLGQQATPLRLGCCCCISESHPSWNASSRCCRTRRSIYKPNLN